VKQSSQFILFISICHVMWSVYPPSNRFSYDLLSIKQAIISWDSML